MSRDFRGEKIGKPKTYRCHELDSWRLTLAVTNVWFLSPTDAQVSGGGAKQCKQSKLKMFNSFSIHRK
jgi:hypothetical protein